MGTCVFCYNTALFIMRRARARLVTRPRVDVSLDDADGGLRDLAQTPWPGWLADGGPVHLVTSSQTLHRASPGCVVHAWGSEGEVWPLIDLGDDVYVVAPEFLFLQMATVLDETALVFLGYELCGCYGFSNGRVVGAPRMTSAHEIEAFLQSRPRARGRAKALRAIRHVVDNSASPMESELALRLTLPVRMGGRGIVAPLLNQSIPLGHDAARAFGHPSITPDLFWEDQRFALEYDSDAEHVGAERIVRDASRRLALEAEGIRVLTVTSEQLRSQVGFNALAHAVEDALGKRHRTPGAASLAQRAKLARDVHRLAVNPALLTLAGRA